MGFVNEVNTKIYRVSTAGDVVNVTNDQLVEKYMSSNGHRYLLLNTIDGNKRLYLQENIVALTFLNVPKYLSQKPIKVIHDDNDFLNNEPNNLKFIEFIEEWKPIIIDGVNTDYFISNIGNVKSIKYGKSKIMAPQKGSNESIKISLRINGRYTNEFIHRLVATAFVSNPDLCEIVNHIDGKRNNPNYLNLEWCTPSQNTKHAVLTGLHKNFHIGSENPASKKDTLCWKLLIL